MVVEFALQESESVAHFDQVLHWLLLELITSCQATMASSDPRRGAEAPPRRPQAGECLRDFGWPDLRYSARTIMVALLRVEELRLLTLVTARSFPLRCHHGVRHHFLASSL